MSGPKYTPAEEARAAGRGGKSAGGAARARARRCELGAGAVLLW